MAVIEFLLPSVAWGLGVSNHVSNEDLESRATSRPLEETGLGQEARGMRARMHRVLIQGSGH